MSHTASELLPLTGTVAPPDSAALAGALRQASADGTPLYPIGGGTSLDYGLPARAPGLGLSLARLDRIVDYPARDMTITVEAGIKMSVLAAALAEQRQRLPVDVPQAERATLGGVIATNASGPLRYGHGTIRDYVIGISVVDGRGMEFKGGGRVVKNVAGYDFCKLLVGSLGTIGVITQATLKVKPLPESSALVACRLRDHEQAEQLLAGLVASRTSPTAIELLAGPAWEDEPALEPIEPAQTGSGFGQLVIALEGTAVEVQSMTATLADEWRAFGVAAHVLPPERAESLWKRLREFPAAREGGQPHFAPKAPQNEPVPNAGLVAKINVPASRTIEMIRLAGEIQPDCSVQAHAGNGVIVVRMPSFPSGGISRLWIGRLQPAAQQVGGSAVILSCSQVSELTRQAVWGRPAQAAMLMEAVHRQFDPKNLLNPGRFVYS
ncbi:MAG TPA: FAD-binding oxidoreductase [Pirellulales bacterium]|jgi:glycolate oxidase FAD binding subunit|nr:FAD-binding oxidoreductase [Pirellulales bacterium]